MSLSQSRVLKPRVRLRLAWKLLYGTGIAVVTLTGVLVVTYLSLSMPETSEGKDLVIFDSAEAFQDTTPVLRGSRNQPMLHIVVVTSGGGSRMKLHSISVSAGGTTLPVESQVRNARLWFTGRDSEFSTTVQVASTVPVVRSGNLAFLVNKPLDAGKNHFWLTFDVAAGATSGGRIDAECNYVQVGTSRFLPFVSAPLGYRRIEDNLPCYSVHDGPPARPATWNTRRDGSGTPPDTSRWHRYTLFVQSGSKLEALAPLNVHSVYVEKGGMLRVNAPLQAHTVIVEEGGILRHDRQADNRVGRLVLYAGATLFHDHEGPLLGATAQLSPGSTVCFYNIGPATVPPGRTWGHVLIFTPGNTPLDLKDRFTTVLGDLEIRKTGTEGYAYFSGSGHMDVRGSFIVSGGVFNGAAAGTLTLDVGKSLVVKDGLMADAPAGGQGHTILRVGGNVVLGGGLFHFNRHRESKLLLVPSEQGQATWSQHACDVRLCDVTIEKGKELHIGNGKLGDIGAGSTLTVSPGAGLWCDRYPVTGAGSFVLAQDARLGIGSIKGIQSEGAEGNILTAKRAYSSDATYIYQSGASPQFTGTFLTAPLPHTVKALIIDKENPEDVVVLSADLAVLADPVVRRGSLALGGFRLLHGMPADPSDGQSR